MVNHEVAAADLLKDQYTLFTRLQMHVGSLFQQMLTKRKYHYVQGASLVVGVQTGLTGGAGFSDAGVFPSAGYAVNRRLTFDWRRLYGSIALDRTFLMDAASEKASFRRPIEQELKTMATELRWIRNVVFAGDGSGLLTAVHSTNDTAGGASTLLVEDASKLKTGMRVDVVKTATGATESGIKGVRIVVNDKVSPAQVYPLDGAWSLVNYGDIEESYSLYIAGSRNAAPNGLKSIVSATNPPTGVPLYGGLDRTVGTNTWVNAVVLNNSGTPRDISLDLLAELREAVSDDDDEMSAQGYVFITHPTLRREIIKLLHASTRYVGGQDTIKGWYKGATWEGIPIATTRTVDPDRLYLVRPSDFVCGQDSDGSWIGADMGKGNIWRARDGVDQYSAHWNQNFQLWCENCFRQGVVTDLQVAA